MPNPDKRIWVEPNICKNITSESRSTKSGETWMLSLFVCWMRSSSLSKFQLLYQMETIPIYFTNLFLLLITAHGPILDKVKPKKHCSFFWERVHGTQIPIVLDASVCFLKAAWLFSYTRIPINYSHYPLKTSHIILLLTGTSPSQSTDIQQLLPSLTYTLGCHLHWNWINISIHRATIMVGRQC